MTNKSVRPPTLSGHFFRNVLILSLAVLLIVGSALTWVAYDEYRQTQEFEFRLLEAHARNANTHVAEELSNIERVLNLIAKARLNHRSSQQELTFAAELELHKKDNPVLGTLLLTDASGRVRTATDATIVGKDVSREPYFSAQRDHARQPKLFMSRPDKHLFGVASIIFSLPMVNTDGQFIGIVGVTIGYQFFPAVMQAINPDDSESMSVIVNRDGDLVYRRGEPKKFFGNNIAKVSTIFREHLSAGRPVTRHVGPSAQNGKTRLFLVQDVNDSGLSLILSRQLDEVLAVWQRNIVIYVLIFIATVTVLSILTLSAARRKQLEAEFAESRERLREIEHRQLLDQERQRLTQDMHDGLGSALVSALRVVEHGHLDDAEIAQVLKGCIDDLKLTIDSMEPVASDLLLLLATLRFRLAPRLESSGIKLHWEIQDVPDLDWLTPRNSLHILRILQEAFTNIIKHTHATEIRVATAVENDTVLVTVTDNGQGFDVGQAQHSIGKGLSNQMRRAESIGGTVSWQSSASGTRLNLRLPIVQK